MTVCLSRCAVALPEGFEEAADIAVASGIPEAVVREKMGIRRKCRASASWHPSEMAIAAARQVLEGVDPQSVNAVIWTGSEYKDYNVWSAGIFVQGQLGLSRAWSFDIAARCSTNIVALRVAKALMDQDPSMKRVLLCGGHRTGDLVDYTDPSTRFLYNLADGGSAILLEHGEENPILESSVITDGAFSRDVIIPAGGTRFPTRAQPYAKDTYLRVPDPEGMKERLERLSIGNFVRVIRDAAVRSLSEQPIDYLGLLHMKRSAHDMVLRQCELRPEQSVYLEDYGHFGAPDQVLSLGLAERRGLLVPGAHVSLAAAGIGYTWSAISLRWDRPAFCQSSLATTR